jgi:hypothetical protein
MCLRVVCGFTVSVTCSGKSLVVTWRNLFKLPQLRTSRLKSFIRPPENTLRSVKKLNFKARGKGGVRAERPFGLLDPKSLIPLPAALSCRR